ncbi:hypothetical protein [Neolewinella antarctica]|uniref:Uncharacterized protein n=1 Tax=Neolewinella antarctica TaxID=442734 RepID=A0ABX0XGM2_9BACT|nr:hypothetical protein [Neolewinella antarctica]NJC28347.1 hypothetical protein [Neolewinella antarctica]
MLGRVGLEFDAAVGALVEQFAEVLEGAEPSVVFGYQEAGAEKEFWFVGSPAAPRAGQEEAN